MTFVYTYIYIFANYIPSMYVYVYILLTFMYIQHYCNCNVNCRFSLYIIYTRYAYHAQELGNHIPIRGKTIFGNGTAENSRHLLVMIYPGGTIYMYTFMYIYIYTYNPSRWKKSGLASSRWSPWPLFCWWNGPIAPVLTSSKAAPKTLFDFDQVFTEAIKLESG